MYYEIEYYQSDLFRALVDERNVGSRGHPVFTALLFTFCPMAAKWWLNGADPGIPYDVVWEAAADFASGMTMKEAFERREVADLLGHAKKYMADVVTRRKTHPYRSSELSPLFTGEEIEVTARAGYQAAFDKHFGGNWRNVLRYVRAWAYTVPDWRGDAEIQPRRDEYKFQAFGVAFNVPRLNRRTLEWPAWGWRVKTGYALRIVLGMMVNDNAQDQLRFALASRSNGYFVDAPGEDKAKRQVVPWEVVPHVYSLDRQAGWARPLNATFDVEKLVASVPSIAAVAEKGACPPLGALVQYKKCEHCGFQNLCFTKDRDVTSLVYESMSQDAQKFDRSIA